MKKLLSLFGALTICSTGAMATSCNKIKLNLAKYETTTLHECVIFLGNIQYLANGKIYLINREGIEVSSRDYIALKDEGERHSGVSYYYECQDDATAYIINL